MLTIQITTGSDVPIFRQIVQQVRGGIAAGKLSVGDALPSVRGLAADLVVNHNTVAKAYSQLVRDGLIESQQGRGYFVTQRREIYTKSERVRRVALLVEPLVSEGTTLGFTPDEIVALVEKELGKLSGGKVSGGNATGKRGKRS
ncbi:Transcriptional regulator, GntR family [Rhodopirellula islandica]|uniref:Transcriptional regulator, GntR family n=1 Tax=Rhodopirellula islandica TaxID=595434 RepID=A0A0J1EIG2_RHOIS|nr:GntR family transcriptional regulator [Rhodopirellula islandica]KLU05309.1 Transcriptional regulator, GntR family [Rhodopirellula islandica]